MRPTFRIFPGDETLDSPEPMATMTVGEFCRILGDATDTDRTWLQDFAEDQVRVPGDLFEVLRAYSRMQAAA